MGPPTPVEIIRQRGQRGLPVQARLLRILAL